MAQATFSVRMDEDLKRNFDNVCNELGMTMSTAIMIFAKKVTREKRIPFDVSVDPFYSETNLSALKKSMEQAAGGKVVIKSLDELETIANG